MNASLKTPAGNPFTFPTQALEEAIAQEWASGPSQEKSKDFRGKPLTQLLATTLDEKIPDVPGKLLTILQNDNLLYWADHPQELLDLQEKNWRPLLETLNHTFSLDLAPSFGFHLSPPSPSGLAQVSTYLQELNPFQQTAFHEMASLAHSFLIPWSLVAGHLPSPLEAWERAQLHETFEEKTWGADPAAQRTNQDNFQDFLTAHRFFILSTP